MLYCPRWCGAGVGLGCALGALVYSGVEIGKAIFDAHSLLVASLLIVLGYQSLLFAGFTKVFAIGERLMPPDPKTDFWVRWATLERGFALGALTFVAGVALIFAEAWTWMTRDFGALDYAQTMRVVIPGVMLATLGFQTVFASFFLSILGMRRK